MTAAHAGGAAGYVPGMTAVLVPIVIVIVLVVIAAVAVKQLGSSSMEHGTRLQHTSRPTLRYLVPPGQDPAEVVNVLRREGYDASPESSEPGPSAPVVVVGNPDGGAVDRERVRAALADLVQMHANPQTDGMVPRPVRFTDE